MSTFATASRSRSSSSSSSASAADFDTALSSAALAALSKELPRSDDGDDGSSLDDLPPLLDAPPPPDQSTSSAAETLERRADRPDDAASMGGYLASLWASAAARASPASPPPSLRAWAAAAFRGDAARKAEAVQAAPKRAADVADYWASADADTLKKLERAEAARTAARAERAARPTPKAVDFGTDDLTGAELAALGKALLRADDRDAARAAWFKARSAKNRGGPAALRKKLEAARANLRDDTRALVMGQVHRRDLEDARPRTDASLSAAAARAERSRRELEKIRVRRGVPLRRPAPAPASPPGQRRGAAPPRKATTRAPAPARRKDGDEAAVDCYWKEPSLFSSTKDPW